VIDFQLSEIDLGTISSVREMNLNDISVNTIHYLEDDPDPHPIGSTPNVLRSLQRIFNMFFPLERNFSQNNFSRSISRQRFHDP